jgi:uncharacterized repeat protein (TIGR01451 family)/fimbrial isopeptide formation D2 family protein
MKYKSIYATILVSLFILSMIILPLHVYAAATIWTDKADYAPNETVTIYGSGFLANVQVTITITAPDLSVATIYAQTDEFGAFTAYRTLDGLEGTYTVAATDGTNTATATFTDTSKYFTSTISPTTANTGQTQTYAITITNDHSSSTGIKLGSAIIVIPSGFTSVSITSVTASGGKDWTGTIVSSQIKLTADYSSDRLDRDEHVSVSFSATAPAAAGTYTWTTTAYTSPSWAGDLFTIKDPPGQPKVTVTAPTYRYFTATISPTTCLAGETKSYTITVTNDMSSSPGVTLGSAEITIPSGFTAVTITSVTASAGKHWHDGVASGKINLDAQDPSDQLNPGQWVSVVFSATAPGTADTYEWTTKAYGCVEEEFTIKGSQPTVTVTVLHPAIDVAKSGPSYAHEGDLITYTITVSNPSTDTTMYKVSVIDSILGALTASFSASLAPSTSESKTFTYTVPSPSGDITNTVTVTYKDASNTQKTDSASWTVDVLHGGIDVSKSGPANAHEGDTITYTITVSNPSADTTMTKVSVIDSVLGDISASFSASLAPLASETKTFTYTVPSPSGDITNTVTAKYKDALNQQKTDTASWTVDVLHPGISVSKSGPACAHEGDTITYTITVSNTGDCQLYGVFVTDSLLGSIYSNGLAFGATKTFTLSYTVPTPSGDISNTVTASGSDILGLGVSDSASWFVDVLHPSIDVTKTGPNYAHEGDTITYTITVSNTGDCPLYSVSVTDTLLGSIYSNGLALGETKTFTVPYTIPIPSGDITNTVTAIGSDILGLQVSDSASWFVKVQYQITVTASPGGAIGGTFKVTYTKCGTTYTNVQKTTTWSEWVDSGTTVAVSSPQDPINDGPGTRYVFVNYNPSASVTMDGPKTITLCYKTQYYLTVLTFPEGLEPTPTPQSGWYDQCTYVTLTAPSTAHIGSVVYTFGGGWQINHEIHPAKENPITIHMDSPKIACARYCELGDPIGDVNLDGKVDMIDIATIARHYGAKLGEPNYSVACDLNLDGKIDLRDLAAAARNFS